jgi:alkylhydroperoxidase family enzyme
MREAGFAAAEKAAIDYAEALTHNNVTETVFAELKRHYSERGIIEITCVACTFNYSNRFNTALDMDLTVYPKKLG